MHMHLDMFTYLQGIFLLAAALSAHAASGRAYATDAIEVFLGH